MNRTLPLAIAVLASSSSVALAQGSAGFNHEGSTISLGFNFHNDGDGDPYSENYTTQLTAQSAYSFGQNLGAIVSLAYSREQYSDDLYSERFVLDLNPTYALGDLEVGAFLSTISRKRNGDTLNYSSYGATASYDAGPVGLEAFAGTYDEDGFEYDIYGIAGSYDISSDLGGYLAYRRDSYDSDSYDASVTLGASYNLASATGMPVTISGELSRFIGSNLSFSESEWNQFSILASYDIGGGVDSVFRGLRGWSYYYD